MAGLSRFACAAALLLQGCAGLGRLSEVGSPPAMSKITDPTREPGFRPVSLPMPRAEPNTTTANSLWRPGSRAFFKDQRAAQIGDIVTVVVNIADSAVVNNATTANRRNRIAVQIIEKLSAGSARDGESLA
jgi:flagellar L-ring protein precursor FlgH